MIYNNINNNNSTPSITLHHFDSTKWKKRLYNLSRKIHHRSHSHNHHHWNAVSATTMAAAKEKFIRHSSIPDHDIAIHSEDLTASQFANLTGIKTKRNHQQHSIYYDVYSSCSSSDEEEGEEEEELEELEEDSDALSTTTTSFRQPAFMRIWDSHYWQHEEGTRRSKSLPCGTTSLSIIAATPIPRQPISESGTTTTTGVIQKGRFQIVWGDQEQQEEQQQQEPMKKESKCVEWKRKRASSNSSC